MAEERGREAEAGRTGSQRRREGKLLGRRQARGLCPVWGCGRNAAGVWRPAYTAEDTLPAAVPGGALAGRTRSKDPEEHRAPFAGRSPAIGGQEEKENPGRGRRFRRGRSASGRSKTSPPAACVSKIFFAHTMPRHFWSSCGETLPSSTGTAAAGGGTDARTKSSSLCSALSGGLPGRRRSRKSSPEKKRCDRTFLPHRFLFDSVFVTHAMKASQCGSALLSPLCGRRSARHPPCGR